MKTNIRQISKATGFSPATVSNALNKKRGVNKETAEIIFKAAKDMGYNFEPKVKKIKFLCCKRHGRIINDSAFVSTLVAGAESQAQELGFKTVFVNLNTLDSDYKAQLKKATSDDTCSAYIILGTELKEEDYEAFTNISAPIVVLDGSSAKQAFDCVMINNAESVQNAVKYLIENGHTKIGYLRGKHRINAFMNRALGFRRAMNAANLPIVEDYIVTVGTTSEQAFDDMTEYLMQNPKLPTAFFADNDLIALGVMRALQQRGYRIPQDVSVIGFDDLDFSKISNPPLTTICVPKEEMGRLAVRRLTYHLSKNSNVNTKILVYTDFIERESVRTNL